MDRGLWRHLPVFFVLATACLSFYALQRVSKLSPSTSKSEQINYEMPRPEAAESEYDLSGREVVRRIHRPAKSNSEVAAKPKIDPAIAAAKAQEKTMAEAKKKAAAEVAAAKKKAQALAKSKADRKFQVTINVAEESQRDLTVNVRDENAQASPANYAPAAPAEDRPIASAPTTDHNIPRISAAQWKSLLMGQPNVKNGNEFLAAFQKKLVDKNSFYQISEVLLTDNAEDRQKLGLFLLRQSPSEESFSILAKHSEDKALEKIKPHIDVVFNDYATAGRLPLLGKLFYSSNAQVVSQAQLVLKGAVLAQNTTQQQVPSQGREARGPGSSAIPSSQFQNFIPALQRLEGSNDQTVVQEAQELIERIKAMHSV